MRSTRSTNGQPFQLCHHIVVTFVADDRVNAAFLAGDRLDPRPKRIDDFRHFPELVV
jgi:hypothetical protein